MYHSFLIHSSADGHLGCFSVGEGEGGMFQENSIETCILSRVKQITSPGWMHETSAQCWCTGKTQRERVEREVGGGIGMGNTCKPIAVSFLCMTKFTTNKKKKKKKEKKRPWCWERLKEGREGDDRGWDGWMASPTQWTWLWVNFGSWWWTGRPGMLQSMESQRAGHDWATELNWTDLKFKTIFVYNWFV